MSFALPTIFVLSTLVATDVPQTLDQQATQALSALEGKSAFLFSEIQQEKVVPLCAVRADERFAVGSSFKLYILGTLIDEVNQGRRRDENVMLLTPELVGPPSTELGQWPAGSPVTLHTLALKMISISDNTATDHLLHLLGRQRVESQFSVMGHSDPSIDRPLLSTRDMVELRDKKRNLPGREYQQLDEAARREFLKKLSAGKPDYDAIEFDTAAYLIAEWYGTPHDLSLALAWIYRHTPADQPAHDLRAVLTVEQKLPHDPAEWPFVGFKGGSEDQILAGNWLLQNRNGRWYTMHLFWNNPTGKADPEKLIKALTQIFASVQKSLN